MGGLLTSCVKGEDEDEIITAANMKADPKHLVFGPVTGGNSSQALEDTVATDFLEDGNAAMMDLGNSNSRGLDLEAGDKDSDIRGPVIHIRPAPMQQDTVTEKLSNTIVVSSFDTRNKCARPYIDTRDIWVRPKAAKGQRSMSIFTEPKNAGVSSWSRHMDGAAASLAAMGTTSVSTPTRVARADNVPHPRVTVLKRPHLAINKSYTVQDKALEAWSKRVKQRE